MEKVIICVDDEKALLSALQQQLFREFSDTYLLEFAESGKEALDLIQEFISLDTEIACVITDQMMPDLTGDRLARDLLDAQGNIPIIMITGFAEKMSAEDSRKIGIREFLLKPVVMEDLGRTVRRVLDESRRSGCPP